MRVLIIDPFGEGLDLAMRAQHDGHQVKHNVRQKKDLQYIGRGLVEVVDDWHDWMRWAELVVVTDNTTYIRELDVWRREGAKIVCASQETAAWEMDRRYGLEIMRKHGIAVPEFKEFHDYDSAIRFVKRQKRRFVSKPSGLQEDKSLSYVSQSAADMVFMLERWKRLAKSQPEFILQEFVEGIEMAVGGWFGPYGWSEGWCENFEFKKLCNGDLGVATGEQGTVLRYVRRSKLAQKVLVPLTETLAKEGYVGYIDVNCIVTDDGHVWPLEFTTRFGWPTLNIQLALNLGDSVEWMMDLAKGRDARNWLLDRVAVGVVMSIPDYPYSKKTQAEVVKIPIYGIKQAMWRHVHPCQMMLADAPVEVEGEVITMPMPATAGDYVLVMTAIGRDVQTARERAYTRLGRIAVPNSPMYRTDIGLRLSEQLPRLQTHGFATGMQFSIPPSASRRSSVPAGTARLSSSASPGQQIIPATTT